MVPKADAGMGKASGVRLFGGHGFPKLFEMGEYLRLLLEFAQRLKLLANVRPVEIPGALADKNVAQINPILRAVGKRLHDDQVLGRACAKLDPWGKGHHA